MAITDTILDTSQFMPDPASHFCFPNPSLQLETYTLAIKILHLKFSRIRFFKIFCNVLVETEFDHESVSLIQSDIFIVHDNFCEEGWHQDTEPVDGYL